MESTNNNNNNQLLSLSEFKELRKEISAMKKRIDQLERSHEKQQERLDILERENHKLKTQLNNFNGTKAVGSVLKRKRTEEFHKKEIEAKSTSVSVSASKKKAKTNNNDDEEAVVIPQRDNGDSFDSLSDDLLHKIVEFDGNCYSKFGSINKRCKNIYDVKEYKLKKQTYVYGYGTVDMILERYLKKRKKDKLDNIIREDIAEAVIMYNHLDAVDWIIQLGDIDLFFDLCCVAARNGRIEILTKMFCNSNVTMLDELPDDVWLCFNAVSNGQLKTLKWLRNHGCSWDAYTKNVARRSGYDNITSTRYLFF